MASSSSNRKRSFVEDEDDQGASKPPGPKRVRFPKGRKVKSLDEGGSKSFTHEDIGPVAFQDPKLAAKERANRRNTITAELFSEDEDGKAEVTYQENENFVEDGIQIEPFNLDQEREEGYFDEDGNFVEYVNENEIKDAWFDSVDVNTNLASKAKVATINEDDTQELSAEDIGKIKKRMADSLEPGETVLQALRRLKGTSNNRKERMTAEKKHIFDQLTEDAAMLMANGEYDVYHEQQEVFQREAEGYERLVRAKATMEASGDGDGFDIFGDGDDDNTAVNVSAVAPTDSADGDSKSDYVFDDATRFHSTFQRPKHSRGCGLYLDASTCLFRYYYSSSQGYYYDPSTGLYCSAASGQWYSFNEATGAYEEIPSNESNAN